MNDNYSVEKIEDIINQDEYQRITTIKEIENLVKTYPNIRLGVNGDWGSGKTVVAKVISYLSNYKFNGETISKIKSYFLEENCNVIYFDASREDIFQNPLLSLGKVITKSFDSNTLINKKNIFKKILELFAGATGLKVINKTYEIIKDETTETSVLDQIFDTEIIIEKIKQLFDNNKNYVLLIDELDRCDPKYVLKLFTTIKHFYNIENLAIVYFYNYSELWEIIKKEYGYKNEVYFQKYIDYEIKLINNYPEYYDYIYYWSMDINKIRVKICKMYYDLTLREQKNLEFMINEKVRNGYKVDYFLALALTHFKIKKLRTEDFTIDYFKKYKTRLSKGLLITYEDELFENLNSKLCEEARENELKYFKKENNI